MEKKKKSRPEGIVHASHELPRQAAGPAFSKIFLSCLLWWKHSFHCHSGVRHGLGFKHLFYTWKLGSIIRTDLDTVDSVKITGRLIHRLIFGARESFHTYLVVRGCFPWSNIFHVFPFIKTKEISMGHLGGRRFFSRGGIFFALQLVVRSRTVDERA